MLSRLALRTKTHLLVIAMVLFSSLGDVFLSKGMKGIGQLSGLSAPELLKVFLETASNGMVWLGVICLLLFFVSYMLVMSWADYSYVMPAAAIGYPIVTFLGYAILREHVSPLGWMGVALICAGVFLVGQTPPRTVHPN